MTHERMERSNQSHKEEILKKLRKRIQERLQAPPPYSQPQMEIESSSSRSDERGTAGELSSLNARLATLEAQVGGLREQHMGITQEGRAHFIALTRQVEQALPQQPRVSPAVAVQFLQSGMAPRQPSGTATRADRPSTPPQVGDHIGSEATSPLATE